MRPIVGQGGGGKTRHKRPGGFPSVGGQRGQKTPGAAPGGFDYAAFNAWQDPSIGGTQPGPIQQGWGGFFGTDDTMLKTKMNNYLNTQAVGGPRETMINQMGYFNQGNPYTPQVPRGYNRELRGNARENQQTGGYSAPGIYQHMGGNPMENAGGYTGFTNVAESGQAQYTPFDINARGGGRIKRRGGTFGSAY